MTHEKADYVTPSAALSEAREAVQRAAEVNLIGVRGAGEVRAAINAAVALLAVCDAQQAVIDGLLHAVGAPHGITHDGRPLGAGAVLRDAR